MTTSTINSSAQTFDAIPFTNQTYTPGNGKVVKIEMNYSVFTDSTMSTWGTSVITATFKKSSSGVITRTSTDDGVALTGNVQMNVNTGQPYISLDINGGGIDFNLNGTTDTLNWAYIATAYES